MPSAPILLTIETNTYAAYNCVGGKCLFPYLSTDRSHSNLVSFERPLQPDIMGGFHAWDQFFTSWLDAEGYQVDYCVNADHDRQPISWMTTLHISGSVMASIPAARSASSFSGSWRGAAT